jgi:hypothetical protein
MLCKLREHFLILDGIPRFRLTTNKRFSMARPFACCVSPQRLFASALAGELVEIGAVLL